MDVFAAVVFLRELRSVQDVAGPALEDLAAKLADEDPGVASLVAQRAARREETRKADNNITPMRPARGTKRRRSGSEDG